MSNECNFHLGIEEKINSLEKQVEDLKLSIKTFTTKDEIEILINKLESDIEGMKKEIDEQYQNTLNTQKTIVRLEEMNNYLKTMLDIYNEQNKSLSEKMDKINDTLSEKIEKIYTLILTKSSGGDKVNFFKDFLTSNKTLIIIILFLVSLLIYLLTGKWVLDEKIITNS